MHAGLTLTRYQRAITKTRALKGRLLRRRRPEDDWRFNQEETLRSAGGAARQRR